MFKPVLDFYLGLFQANGEAVLKSLCNCVVPPKIIIEAYAKLPPIETLPEKEKLELWEYAKTMYPDGDKGTRVRFTKITYTIGNLL